MTPADHEPMRLSLIGPLTVRTIDEVAARLTEALARHETVLVDCAGAEAVDVSFIQLLLAARRSAGARLGLAMPLPGPLLEALERGGFRGDGRPTEAFWQPAADRA